MKTPSISQKDKVYQAIKERIVTQHVKPGEMLNERALAFDMGISRTPVREALKLLEKEGLVRTEPWRGTFVSRLTMTDIREVFQLRLILEPQVIELILPKLHEGNIARLDRLYAVQQRIYQQRITEEFIGVDREFHMYLVSLTENNRLISILQNLNDIIIRLGIEAVTTDDKDRFGETLREHMNIIGALRRRDGFQAKNYMMLHLLNTQDTIRTNWPRNEREETR